MVVFQCFGPALSCGHCQYHRTRPRNAYCQYPQTRAKGVQRERIASRSLCQGARGTASPYNPRARQASAGCLLGVILSGLRPGGNSRTPPITERAHVLTPCQYRRQCRRHPRGGIGGTAESSPPKILMPESHRTSPRTPSRRWPHTDPFPTPPTKSLPAATQTAPPGSSPARTRTSRPACRAAPEPPEIPR